MQSDRPQSAAPTASAAAPDQDSEYYVPDPAFVEQVIAEAKKTFTPGREFARHKPLVKKWLFFRPTEPFKDNRFKRNAHWLPETNYIASTGPSIDKEIPAFLEDTVYNPYRPIHQVVALGHCLAYNDYTYRDFYDYCLKERLEHFGPYHVRIKRSSGGSKTTVSEHQIYPKKLVQSRLMITPDDSTGSRPDRLNVTLISLRDGCALDLSDAKRAPLKEVLWQLFLKSLNEPILVHCTAGEGRTGHLILTLEILRFYTFVFSGKDASKSAAQIHDILNDMRTARPALVHNEKQFEMAIRNAGILYQYGLQKRLAAENLQTARIAAVTPASPGQGLFATAQKEAPVQQAAPAEPAPGLVNICP